MDETIDRLVISVRADTASFARDVGVMRGELEGPLAAGATRAGRTIEHALGRAIVNGKLGFDDLKKIALSAMAEIASASLRNLFGSIGGSGGQGGLGGLLSGVVSSLFAAPGRATGGPVSAGRGYMVGEHGPELFVPQGAGRVERIGGQGGGDVRVAISVVSPQAGDPAVLRQSSRQVANAVRSAIRGERR